METASINMTMLADSDILEFAFFLVFAIIAGIVGMVQKKKKEQQERQRADDAADRHREMLLRQKQRQEMSRRQPPPVPSSSFADSPQASQHAHESLVHMGSSDRMPSEKMKQDALGGLYRQPASSERAAAKTKLAVPPKKSSPSGVVMLKSSDSVVSEEFRQAEPVMLEEDQTLPTPQVQFTSAQAIRQAWVYHEVFSVPRAYRPVEHFWEEM